MALNSGSMCSWFCSAAIARPSSALALSSDFLQRIDGGLHRVAQGLGIRQAPVLGIEFVPLVGAGRELVDFADLPGQALAFALQAVLGIARFQQCLLRPGATAASGARVRRWKRPHRSPAGRAPRRAASGFARRAGRGCRPGGRRSPLSCVAVAALPLIQARLLPCTSIVRRSSRLSPPSKPACSSQAARPLGLSNSTLISQRAAPSRTTPASARAPRASCRASIRMDLPAPVSPVSTVKPAGQVQLEFVDDDEIAKRDAFEAHR